MQHGARSATARGMRLLGLAMVVAAVILVGTASSRAAEPVLGRVVHQEGEARASRTGEQARTLGIGAPIFARDEVMTAENGRLKIEFADRSLIVIGGGSRIFIADYAVSERGRRTGAMLSLLSGIIRAVAANPGGHFSVGSRAAVASARSTEWLMEADPTSAAVFAAAGRVAVQAVGTNASVLLQPGEGTDVPADGTPTPPKEWGQARVDDFLARTRLAAE